MLFSWDKKIIVAIFLDNAPLMSPGLFQHLYQLHVLRAVRHCWLELQWPAFTNTYNNLVLLSGAGLICSDKEDKRIWALRCPATALQERKCPFFFCFKSNSQVFVSIWMIFFAMSCVLINTHTNTHTHIPSHHVLTIQNITTSVWHE